MNIVRGTLRQSAGRAYVEAAGARWPLASPPGAQDGQRVTYGIRPEHLAVAAGAGGDVIGQVIVVEPTGSETELVVGVGDIQLVVTANGRPGVRPGDALPLAIAREHVHLFDETSGQRLAA